jgi:hypothetical protein
LTWLAPYALLHLFSDLSEGEEKLALPFRGQGFLRLVRFATDQPLRVYRRSGSINLALTIAVRGQPMRKIHPGFTAIAILLGPAALISGHHKLTSHLSSPDPAVPDLAKVLHQIYLKCSEPPKLRRTVQCDQYVSYVEQCVTMKNRCDPRASYELLIKLDFSPPLLGLPLPDKIALIAVSDS